MADKQKNCKNKAEVTQNIPKHIGIIMDGNGRWAQKRLMPRKFGHRQGVETIKKTTGYIFDKGVECISLYAFSTENQARPEDEVESLFDLMRAYFTSTLDELIADKIKLVFMGDLSYFPEDLQQKIELARLKSCDFKNKTLNFALNYGSQFEIVKAANEANAKYGTVTKQGLEEFLYTNGLPPLDMIIRTAGEKRLSNFMLYQSAYAEFFFLDTLWPDFNKKSVDAVLEEFTKRTRRFGKVVQ